MLEIKVIMGARSTGFMCMARWDLADRPWWGAQKPRRQKSHRIG